MSHWATYLLSNAYKNSIVSTIHILIHTAVISAQSPITQLAMAALTPHPVWLLHSYLTNQDHFSLYQKITQVRKLKKCLSTVWFCVRQKKRKKTERDRITSNIQFSPAAVAFINAIALSRGAWHTQANSLWSTCTHSLKHATANTQHTQLEADAVLISVTVAEPHAAQITAGVQTMEEKGCLHKGEHGNKGFRMQTSPGMSTDKTYSMMEKNHQNFQSGD